MFNIYSCWKIILWSICQGLLNRLRVLSRKQHWVYIPMDMDIIPWKHFVRLTDGIKMMGPSKNNVDWLHYCYMDGILGMASSKYNIILVCSLLQCNYWKFYDNFPHSIIPWLIQWYISLLFIILKWKSNKLNKNYQVISINIL